MRAGLWLGLVLAAAALSAARAGDAPPEHELRTGGEVTVAVGGSGSGSLTIVPAPGRRIDTRAPVTVRLSVTPAEGLELARRRLALADAADPRADAPRFDVALMGKAAGAYVVTADVRFWVCGAKTCRPVWDRAEIAVTVTEPPAAAAPAERE